MQMQVPRRMAKVLVWDMNANARVTVSSTTCRTGNCSNVRSGDYRQREDRNRLCERVREIADGEDTELEREHLIDDNCERRAPRARPVPPDSNVKRRRCDRVNSQRNDSQQVHVRGAADDEPLEQRGKQVKARRVREGVVSRRD